jgi:putative nucleotidyltransferase with HDIG domain
MVILLWMKPKGRPLHRMLFNMAAPSVAIWLSGTAFYFLHGIEPYSKTESPLSLLFVPLVTLTALYFLLNSWLVAIAIGLENRRPIFSIWWKNFAWLSVNYFSGASVSALIVTYSRRLDFSTLAIIIPLLLVSYLTFRTAMGRAEDSYAHLSELNKLYLSTIETLAMAIDAKDQITHGHIRRVQAYAVGLAKALDVADDGLLKAIEAAALLHDMGKLAVPEHILNKPGKLTPAEFEKMKLHAEIGADILSAIEFPYPVVPIVRHHHENWDGTGYPTGLRGTDIPIGARILSVVDCFDALTSDRPYRPRLSDEAAIEILMARRGSMYDPLVVDTFIRVHRDITPAGNATRVEHQALSGIVSSTERKTVGPPREHGAMPSQALPRMARYAAFREVETIVEAGEAIGQHLRLEVPFALAILYLYDAECDHLVARHVTGDDDYVVRELRISLGDRLSGWVAANRRTIANSNPRLDLGTIVDAFRPVLRASLSMPLLTDGELLGVLALYSQDAAFDANQQAAAERAAALIARGLSSGFKPSAQMT